MQYNKEIPERYYYNKNKIKKLSEVFENIGLKRIKKKKNINDDILNIWENFMDSDLKEHGKISDIKNGVLFIEVDSHPWLYHFTNFCKQNVLSILQEESKKTFISDIRFKLQSGS